MLITINDKLPDIVPLPVNADCAANPIAIDDVTTDEPLMVVVELNKAPLSPITKLYGGFVPVGKPSLFICSILASVCDLP